GAYQTSPGGGDFDAFVTKLNASGTGLIFSTYLGGNGSESGRGVAADSSGSAYVSGYTSSGNFPTTPGAYQTSYGGGVDASGTKLNASGTGLIYPTALGGKDSDGGSAIAVDSSPNAYIAGGTGPSDFPTTAGALHTTYGGGESDAFVSKLNNSGTGLVYST